MVQKDRDTLIIDLSLTINNIAVNALVKYLDLHARAALILPAIFFEK